MPFVSLDDRPTNTDLMSAVKTGNLRQIKAMLSEVNLLINPQINDSAPLREASRRGNAAILKVLIPYSDPSAVNCAALKNAADYGYLDCAKVLIPVSTTEGQQASLAIAAENGYLPVVKALLRVCRDKEKNAHALRLAAQAGQVEIVKALIPVSHPKANYSQALRTCVSGGHTLSVRALCPVSDVLLVGRSLANAEDWHSLDTLTQEVTVALRREWLREFEKHLPLSSAKQTAADRQQKVEGQEPIINATRHSRPRC